jgi:hypothetical protein
MYKLLDCRLIEIVYLSRKKIMVIDEEGKLTDKAYNSKATRVAHQHGAIAPFDYIAGHALVCDSKEVK